MARLRCSCVLYVQRLTSICRRSHTRTSSTMVVSQALCPFSPTSKSSSEHRPLTVFYCTAAHYWPWTRDLDTSLQLMPTLDYYWLSDLDLDLDVTNWSMTDGLLLYSGYTGELNADFISISLTHGHVEFSFSLGTGSATIRSDNFN